VAVGDVTIELLELEVEEETVEVPEVVLEVTPAVTVTVTVAVHCCESTGKMLLASKRSVVAKERIVQMRGRVNVSKETVFADEDRLQDSTRYIYPASIEEEQFSDETGMYICLAKVAELYLVVFLRRSYFDYPETNRIAEKSPRWMGSKTPGGLPTVPLLAISMEHGGMNGRL
jgi:hypothetical protein